MPQLPDIVSALLDPNAYPAPPRQIDLVQTQMSFVFLTPDYVYKIKKPVNLGYLDYTTLEKRHLYCHKEVELNRRLCPDTYLAVIPVTQEGSTFVLGGKGEIVDYAVKMRHLPQDRMMNVLLAAGGATPQMVARLAEKLADFHRRAETGETVSAFGSLDIITRNTGENFSQTEKYLGKTLSKEKYDRIRRYTEGFIAGNVALFRERVASGRIRDCHGDLHTAHICFTDGICIYDCIEFNDRFRYADIASEIAFLAMDLDHYGRADLSRLFIRDYVAASGDQGIPRLVGFYKCYRAYVRGKVESFQLDDPYIGEDRKRDIQESASSYFDLSASCTRSKPLLVITAGVTGTGKTSLAQALARRLGLVVVSSDVVRKQLAAISPLEHRFENLDTGIYSPEFTRKTYDEMLARAREVLADGGAAILDASFVRSLERRNARALAEESGADFFIVECTLDENLTKQRLAQRLEQPTASDGRPEILGPQKARFEPVSEVPPDRHVIIETTRTPADLARAVADRIPRRTGA